MKQKATILVFMMALTFPVFSQLDYREYKNRYNISCGIPDTTLLLRNQKLVDSLGSMLIIAGQKEYLYDHGWVYYMRYVKWKDLEDMKIAAHSFEKGWKEYHDLAALWNLGSIYRVLGNCEKALDMTELYIEQVADSIPVNYQQIYYRYKNCREN